MKQELLNPIYWKFGSRTRKWGDLTYQAWWSCETVESMRNRRLLSRIKRLVRYLRGIVTAIGNVGQ